MIADRLSAAFERGDLSSTDIERVAGLLLLCAAGYQPRFGWWTWYRRRGLAEAADLLVEFDRLVPEPARQRRT